MIPIVDGLEIPDQEIVFTASRSGGPGGQNVNKVSTKVTLWFDLEKSAVLSPEQRHQIRSKLASRINKEGVLQVSSQRSRSQDANRQDVTDRFAALLQQALRREAPRIETKVPRAARTGRIEDKKMRTRIKQLRSGKVWDE